MTDPVQPDSDLAQRLGLSRLNVRRFSRRQQILISLGVLVLLAIVYFLTRSGPRHEYITQAVTRGDLTVSVSATGTLQPKDQVDVGAEVSGRIDAISVDFNSHVTKGQSLARINTDQILAQLSQARATLSQAQATLNESSQVRTRFGALIKSKAISPQDLDTANANYERARAGVSLAAAQVKQMETSLSKATIYSPIDGVVLDRKVSVGQTVVAAMTTPVLFTLASDLSEMELDVDVDEADVGQIRTGAQATFTVDAYPSRQFSAQLVSLHNAPKTVQGVVTYQGVLMVTNPEHLLKPGMTATAEIKAQEVHNALLVPNAALRFVPPDDVRLRAPAPPPIASGTTSGRVWVHEARGIVPRDLKLGPSDGRRTVVLSGDLSPGDNVATDLKGTTPSPSSN
ncbi:MAG TPA: efflux RND transporter periplasmic adaptor subunit [Rhizomicrobium sp.]|nr:efflux RND transporter periplasmic adaptor subunit [Rhizomicrobium sp.]